MRLGVLACAIVIACDPGRPVAVASESTTGFEGGESSGGSPIGSGSAGGGGSASGGSASGGQATTWSIGGTTDGESTSEGSAADENASDDNTSADTTGGDEPKPQTPMGEIPDVGLIAVSGFVEAGPFVAGSSVEIWALDSLGYPYAIAATTEVDDDTGAFGPVDVPAAVIEVRAEGHYFDIVADAVSSAPLRLEVVAVANGKPIHVNVLGHVARPHITERLHDGESVNWAFTQGYQTALASLGTSTLLNGGLSITGPSTRLSLQGPDDGANAFLLAATATLHSASHVFGPNDPTGMLQQLIDALAGKSIEFPVIGYVVTGPYAVDKDDVETALQKYYGTLGVQIATPDLDRVIDTDDDWVWDIDDNCITLSNEYQNDFDQDGVGDICDCDMDGPDPDGDGWPSGCDTCDDVPNAPYSDHFPGFWENPNWDGDEWGNACDSCPRSNGVGGVPGENCCDPRGPANCSKTVWSSLELFKCVLQPSGDRFDCRTYNYCDPWYGSSWIGMCGDNALPWLPVGAFPVTEGCPEGEECSTKWCTVGDDAPCNLGALDGITCIPWFESSEAPEGLEELGICALANEGPCAGVVGNACAHWVGQG